MGNRGGRLHDPRTRELGGARWRSRAWICCRLSFRDRQRQVMGRSYTEFFFLDEATALAAGHRPCFECRRADAHAFQASWVAAGLSQETPSAPDMDRRLDAERRNGREKRTFAAPLQRLPEGAFFRQAGNILVKRADRLLQWDFSGYRDVAGAASTGEVEVLTPPAIVAVLAAGYRPTWHASAGTISDERKTRQTF
jgi:hypothetical protein